MAVLCAQRLKSASERTVRRAKGCCGGINRAHRRALEGQSGHPSCSRRPIGVSARCVVSSEVRCEQGCSAQVNAKASVFAGFPLDPRQRLLFGPDGQPVVTRQEVLSESAPTPLLQPTGQVRACSSATGRGKPTRVAPSTTSRSPYRQVARREQPILVLPNPPLPRSITQLLAEEDRRVWIAGFAAAAAVVVVVVAGLFLMRRTAPVPTDSGSSSTPSSVVIERPRIAVLPFENLSPDPNNAFCTDGMHEEVLTAPAKELHCNYVLEGAMRRDGSDVRLALQLIDARADTHVWAKHFDRRLVSAMALESEVASAVRLPSFRSNSRPAGVLRRPPPIRQRSTYTSRHASWNRPQFCNHPLQHG
jgi:TolB-like protein